MRYRSLTSVDFILIDGRNDSCVLRTVVNQALMALSDHLPCHIVVLCNTKDLADEMDSLGEQCGQGLFFHGEKVDTSEEFQLLLNAAKLFVVPSISRSAVLSTYEASRCDAPFLLATPAGTRFYAGGISSEQYIETSPFRCFFSISK